MQKRDREKDFVIEFHLSKSLMDRFYYHRHRRRRHEIVAPNPFSDFFCFIASEFTCLCLCQFRFIFAAKFSAFMRFSIRLRGCCRFRECQSKYGAFKLLVYLFGLVYAYFIAYFCAGLVVVVHFLLLISFCFTYF